MKTAASSRLLVYSVLTLLAGAAAIDVDTTAVYAAATVGTVTGTIRDINGAAVPNASVTLTNSVGGTAGNTISTKTTGNGTYTFVGIVPGTYTVAVSALGKEPISSPVVVQQDFTSTVDITLAPRSVRGVTRIIPNQVRRNDPTTAYVISAKTEQETKSQPNNLYQFPGLVFGQPGITPDPSGYTHIRGSDFNQVGFDVDGIQITEPMTNSFATNLVTVGLKSANLYTGSADASFGGATGGFINEVTENGKDFALGGKKLGGVVEGTFGPAYGWNYRGTNSQIGGILSNGKFDYYGASVLFANNFPHNTQISHLTASADAILKFNYYLDQNNTITYFHNQGFESYQDYQPFLGSTTFDQNTQNTVTSIGSNDHDDQGYSFDYGSIKHNISPSSYINFRQYRLKNFVQFQVTNLAGEYEDRHATVSGSQLDYQNNFSRLYSLTAGVNYTVSSTHFNVITGATEPYAKLAPYGYNDRVSDVSPREVDEYIQNTLKTPDQKGTLNLGLRLGQDEYDRKVYSDYSAEYADPRVGLSYSPTRDFVVRSSFSISSQFPDTRLTEFLFPEQDGLVPVTATDPAAQLEHYSAHYDQDNPLRSEHSQNYDLGLEQGVGIPKGFFTGSYDATATVYRRIGYDQIQANYSSYLGSPYPIYYNNNGHAHSSGIETQVSKRAVKQSDWNGFVTYTNQVAKANNSDFDTGYLPYFGTYEYGNTNFSSAQFAQFNNQEFSTTYDQRHTVAVVVDKRFSRLFEGAAFLDAGSGFPFSGGPVGEGSLVGEGETSQFSDVEYNGSDFSEIPTVLPNQSTLQPNNPVVGRSGWHYKITLNSSVYVTQSTSLFLNVDNIFDRLTVLNYSTSTQSGQPYYAAPSAQYPEGRVYYGKSTVLTPIFLSFGFRSRF